LVDRGSKDAGDPSLKTGGKIVRAAGVDNDEHRSGERPAVPE